MKRKINYLFVIMLIITACSKDDDTLQGASVSQLDLEKTEGKYVGQLTSTLVTFSVSAIIRESNDNTYNVELFETSNFVPAHNSNGVTAEVRGSFIKEGSTYNVDLSLNSDMPICTGDYIGSGTRNDALGKFELNINFTEICEGVNYNGSFVYNLTKVDEL